MSAATSTIIGITAAAVGAGTSIAGGMMARSGAEDQAQAAERSSAAAIAENRRQYDQNRTDLAPWRNVGAAAIQKLGYLMGLTVPGSTTAGGTGTPATSGTSRFATMPGSSSPTNPPGTDPRMVSMDGTGPGPKPQFDARNIPDGASLRALIAARQGTPAPNPNTDPEFGSLNRDFTLADFEKDPGYEFRLDEGYKGIERKAAARGGLASGATGKALVRFGSDYASNEIGNGFNRFEINRTGRYNRYAGLAGIGQQSAAQLATLGTENARNIGDLIVGGATSAAAARAAGGAALAQGLNGASNGFMNWYLMNRMLQQPTSGGSTGQPSNWIGT
jgi:hypothetical protein